MPDDDRDLRKAVLIAATTSAAMIAFQMGAKATRDALFLSSYDVERLPVMVIASALVSLGLALVGARLLTRVGPGRFVPLTFFVSCVLLLVEWRLVGAARGPVAIAVYLHYGALGAILVSGFWSLVNERFDPRSAKRHIGRIASGGTVGGLVGGVLAERVAVWFTIDAMFPALAALHLGCAWLAWQLAGTEYTPRTARTRNDGTQEMAAPASGLRIIARSPYLLSVVALVLVTTVAEGLLDWVFKARATDVVGRGEDLLRLFAVFYTGVALVTIAVQAVASRRVLQRFGLARTISGLPAATAIGGLVAVAFPGLASAAAARGGESVLRHGMYRPAYELLFTALPPNRKRPIKALMDVGVVRIGDIGGGALVQVVLVLAAAAIQPTLLLTAVVLSVGGMLLAMRIHRGYVRSLERSLVAQADDADRDTGAESAPFQSTAMLHLTAAGLSLPETDDPETDDPEPAGDAPIEAPAPDDRAASADPLVRRILDLRSREERRVRRALAAGPVTRDLAPHAIRLLAWEEVMTDAVRALRAHADRFTGLLVDHLLDPDEPFAIRRRIPLVLVVTPTPRAFNGLFCGLGDRRFEVRYRCGRALLKLHEDHPGLSVDRDRVIDAVLQEMDVDRGVWRSHRLLDRADADDEGWAPLAGQVLRERADRSLEHVFTLLALIMSREPLGVAFRALHTDDRQLRGTALEYLETALPSRVRGKLWPFLEEDASAPAPGGRPSDEVLRELMRSNDSIVVRLEHLERDAANGEDETG